MSGLMKWLGPDSERNIQRWCEPVTDISTACASIAGNAAHEASQGADAILDIPHASQLMSGCCMSMACGLAAIIGIAIEARLSPPVINATSSSRETSFLAITACTYPTMRIGTTARKAEELSDRRLATS